jgi:hypothetical protein
MLTSARTGAAAAAAVPERRPVVAADLWVLAGLTVLAAVLRFATLTSQSYWFDEAQAAHELGRSLGGMLSLWSANEPNPPLYFVIAWPWAKVFGTGEGGLRALSAVFGVALIPVVWLAGRELVSSRAGLAAAALAAVSPFMIWYSQEAREYMLLMLLCGASVWLFARVLPAPSGGRIAWWAVVSALALATQYFAAFLIFAEAAWLLWRVRSRTCALAVGALVLVECALLPHALDHASHPAHWIDSVGPLSIRLQQVPVTFGLNTLYRSSLVTHGLLGAAALAAVVIVLLVVGADGRELRGAGIAAALAGAVVLIPLVLALLGRDYFEPRALSPAWIPLAVVLGAACTARRTRVAGVLLFAVLIAAFVWAGVRIDNHATFQRPDWHKVATALGAPTSARAIVAYDGSFATAPLALYLPGVAWTGSTQIPQPATGSVRVGEVDVVGNIGDRISPKLPTGVSVIGSRTVDGSFTVARFRLARPSLMTRAAIRAEAGALLAPAVPAAGLIVQRPVPAAG